MVPVVGSTIRLIIRNAVVLPQPEGPTKTVSTPSGTSRFSWSTAVVSSANTLLTWSKRIIVVLRPNGVVETVVAHPFPCRLVGIHAGVTRHCGVEFRQTGGGQLGGYGIEHIFETIRLLLR